jgi:hypothetical protein
MDRLVMNKNDRAGNIKKSTLATSPRLCDQHTRYGRHAVEALRYKLEGRGFETSVYFVRAAKNGNPVGLDD